MNPSMPDPRSFGVACLAGAIGLASACAATTQSDDVTSDALAQCSFTYAADGAAGGFAERPRLPVPEFIPDSHGQYEIDLAALTFTGGPHLGYGSRTTNQQWISLLQGIGYESATVFMDIEDVRLLSDEAVAEFKQRNVLVAPLLWYVDYQDMLEKAPTLEAADASLKSIEAALAKRGLLSPYSLAFYRLDVSRLAQDAAAAHASCDPVELLHAGLGRNMVGWHAVDEAPGFSATTIRTAMHQRGGAIVNLDPSDPGLQSALVNQSVPGDDIPGFVEWLKDPIFVGGERRAFQLVSMTESRWAFDQEFPIFPRYQALADARLASHFEGTVSGEPCKDFEDLYDDEGNLLPGMERAATECAMGWATFDMATSGEAFARAAFSTVFPCDVPVNMFGLAACMEEWRDYYRGLEVWIFLNLEPGADPLVEDPSEVGAEQKWLYRQAGVPDGVGELPCEVDMTGRGLGLFCNGFLGEVSAGDWTVVAYHSNGEVLNLSGDMAFGVMTVATPQFGEPVLAD